MKAVPSTTEVRMDPKTNTIVRDGRQSVANPFDTAALEVALAIKDELEAPSRCCRWVSPTRRACCATPSPAAPPTRCSSRTAPLPAPTPLPPPTPCRWASSGWAAATCSCAARWPSTNGPDWPRAGRPSGRSLRHECHRGARGRRKHLVVCRRHRRGLRGGRGAATGRDHGDQGHRDPAHAPASPECVRLPRPRCACSTPPRPVLTAPAAAWTARPRRWCARLCPSVRTRRTRLRARQTSRPPSCSESLRRLRDERSCGR